MRHACGRGNRLNGGCCFLHSPAVLERGASGTSTEGTKAAEKEEYDRVGWRRKYQRSKEMQTEGARLSFLITDVDSAFPIYSEEQSPSVAGLLEALQHMVVQQCANGLAASGEGRSAAASDWVARAIA